MKVAVDIVVYRSDGKILFIERKFEPFRDRLALPGGFAEDNETLEEAASRELFEETGIRVCTDCLQKVGAFTDPKRDPRGRVISFCFFAHLPVGTDPVAGDDARTARFYGPDEAEKFGFAFDHVEMLAQALQHIMAAETATILKGILGEAA
jgi:8-oxo-dGTP diphosphatase